MRNWLSDWKYEVMCKWYDWKATRKEMSLIEFNEATQEQQEEIKRLKRENEDWEKLCHGWKEMSDTWQSDYYKMKELYDTVVFERDSYKAQLMDKQQEQERC